MVLVLVKCNYYNQFKSKLFFNLFNQLVFQLTQCVSTCLNLNLLNPIGCHNTVVPSAVKSVFACKDPTLFHICSVNDFGQSLKLTFYTLGHSGTTNRKRQTLLNCTRIDHYRRPTTAGQKTPASGAYASNCQNVSGKPNANWTSLQSQRSRDGSTRHCRRTLAVLPRKRKVRQTYLNINYLTCFTSSYL